MDLKDLIEKSLAAKTEFERLRYDEPMERPDPGPAAEAQLAKVEDALGRALPTDLKAFYRVRDGFAHFDGDAHILSLEDHLAAWVGEAKQALSDLFVEFEDHNPIAEGALVVMIGRDARPSLIHDGSEYIEYDWVEEIDRYRGLADYIADDLDITLSMIEDQRQGSEELE